jgi:AAA domain/Bifunctional DNA primase/polymerase, N-terminal
MSRQDTTRETDKAAGRNARRERRLARSAGAAIMAAHRAGKDAPNKVITEMPTAAAKPKESNVTPLWPAAKAVDTIKRASAEGYFPITCLPASLKKKNAGKQPARFDRGVWGGWKDWETEAETATLDQLTGWHGETNSVPNVGILCGTEALDGFFIGVDIDCEASDLVGDIAKLAGSDIAIRKGRPERSGLIMLVVDELGDAEKFQCGGPENTIQLLREGKQFVAAGIHPDAKQPYRWEDTDEMPVDMPALAALPRVKMTDLVRVLGENGFHPATTSASKPASGRKAELLAELRESELDEDSFDELFVDDGAPFPLAELRAINPAFYALYKKYADGVDDPASVSHNGNRVAVWKDFLRETWPENFTIAHAKVFSLVWPGAGEYVDRKTTKGQCDDERLVNSFSAAEAAIKREKAGEVKQHSSTKLSKSDAFGAIEDDESAEDNETDATEETATEETEANESESDKTQRLAEKTEAKERKRLEKQQAKLDAFLAGLFRSRNHDEYEAPDDLVANLIPAVGITILVGNSNSGKTFLLMEMLRCLKSGTKFLGRNLQQCEALLITGEGHGGTGKRLRAMRKRWPEADIDVHGALPTFTDLDAAVAKLRDMLDMYESLVGRKVRLLALDNLLLMTGSLDGDKANVASPVLNAVKAFANERQISIVIAAHENKSGKDAGSYGWRALCDNMLYLKEGAAGVRHIEGDKLRDGATDFKMKFKLDVEKIGEDRWGDPVTSCVVVPMLSGEALGAVTDDEETPTVLLLDRREDRVQAVFDVFERQARRDKEGGGTVAAALRNVLLPTRHIVEQVNARRKAEGMEELGPSTVQALIKTIVDDGGLEVEGTKRLPLYKVA